MTLNSETFYVSKLVPELRTQLQKRYRMLQMIQSASPVGRRALADLLQLTERAVRNETMILKQQGLIDIHQKGMRCTELGVETIEQLRTYIHEMSGLSQKEILLAKMLRIERAIIVNSLEDEQEQKSLLGEEAAKLLHDLSEQDDIIAVTGGSTVGAIAEHLTPVDKLQSVCFVAARGGIGSTVHDQANTIVAQFGTQASAQFKPLFVPENLSEQSYEAIRNEPVITQVTSLYDEVNLVIHGIGSAAEMAKRRNSSAETKTLLQNVGAMSEAFGYCFDKNGKVVHKLPSIGIKLEQVQRARAIIAVASGKQKVSAIESYFKSEIPNTYFVTDEKTAEQLLSLKS